MEGLRHVGVRASHVDVVADGADEQRRPLRVCRLQDGVDAQAEQEGAERVALLLPGAGLEDAHLAVRAPDGNYEALTRAYAIQGLRALIFELFPRALSARGEYFRAP